MIQSWVLGKLKAVKDESHVLLMDPLQLISSGDGALHAFATANGFTVISAATNLVFRDHYVKLRADPEARKLLLLDRTPAKRRRPGVAGQAPPVFCPDFLDRTAPEARITLDLRELLRETTTDAGWPVDVNDPRYARLIVQNLAGVLVAHRKLRIASPDRFTDHDFKTIVAYAALGIPEAAFKTAEPETLWRMVLAGHEAMNELETLVPEVTRPLREALEKAPPPFSLFSTHDTETVLSAFYLSVVLSQHLPGWHLLLAHLDPALAPLPTIPQNVLSDASSALFRLNERQAFEDLSRVEDALSREAVASLAEQLHLASPEGFASVLEKEQVSTFLRSLALLLALDDLVGLAPATQIHAHVEKVIFGGGAGISSLADRRPSRTWTELCEAYRFALDLSRMKDRLASFTKGLSVKSVDKLTFGTFWEEWVRQGLHRIEVTVSHLGRLVQTAQLLPRRADDLPSVFENALVRVRARVETLSGDIARQIDTVNIRFQELVVNRYSGWLEGKDGKEGKEAPVLTSQFLVRCLKPFWDPEKERALVLVFDGMRTDIWDDLVKPAFLERLDLVKELKAASILPTETETSRWALAAGAEPAGFWPRRAENTHLAEGLRRWLGIETPVEAVAPPGAGTGETVRYRADRLDWVILEFCDKELHKLHTKKLPDGREVPSRPLALVYQGLKAIVDNEVMAFIRDLPAGTKVFVTADHGFGPVGRDRLTVDMALLNEPADCSYGNAWLRTTLTAAAAPKRLRENTWEIPVSTLHLPPFEDIAEKKTGAIRRKDYVSVIFPKTGFALGRPTAGFNPDAFGHGGLSMQELMVPMAVLRVREKDPGLVLLDTVSGPADIAEGQESIFTVPVRRGTASSLFEEVRVNVDGVVTGVPGVEGEKIPPKELPRQVVFVGAPGDEVSFTVRVGREDVIPEERMTGVARRRLTVTASYRDGTRAVRRTASVGFAVQLSSDQVIRRVGNLGSLLGLTPRSMR